MASPPESRYIPSSTALAIPGSSPATRTRAEPSRAASRVDGLSFDTTASGRTIRRFAIVLANDPTDRCPVGKVAGLHIDKMKPDPDGRFSAGTTSASFRYELTGRFLVRRRASGTVTEADLDPVTHRVICQFRAAWLARVLRY